MQPSDAGFFDPASTWSNAERNLPHWSQPGTLCFITWRLGDSLPRSALERLDAELRMILQAEGLPTHPDWRRELSKRPLRIRSRIEWRLFTTRDKFLNAGYGSCLLGKPEHATTVMASLKRFDGVRYLLTDAIVMPNHVHMIVAFAGEDVMLKQSQDWKRFIARAINAAEKRSGELWQTDQFDHLIRNETQFQYLRNYIRDNPESAGIVLPASASYRREMT
jgi:type I restriction enzyme R subunit